MIQIDGLASGINYSAIIDSIVGIEEIGVLRLEARIAEATAQKTAYLDISARLLAAQGSASILGQPITFDQTKIQNSAPDILEAFTQSGFQLDGTFNFTVKQLATSDQFVSQGFASKDFELTPGQVTIEVGNGSIQRDTELATLNGGQGVTLGQIQITDKSGNSRTIDLTAALTVTDVIDTINAEGGVQVQAALNAAGDGIEVTDISAGGGNLIISEISGGTTATELGIAGSTAGASLGGASSLLYVAGDTLLTELNDGRGVRIGPGNDFNITLTDGTTTANINLDGADTIQDVIDAINAADPNLQASISPDGKGLTVTDTLGGGNQLTIANAGSLAAEDLGLTNAVAKSEALNEIGGRDVLAGLNTVLLTSLNGGAGVEGGLIDIQDRQGNLATIDLSGAQTVQDVIDAINNNGIAQVNASFNNGNSGLRIVDISGGGGNLIINENGATQTAANLGIENGAGVASNIYNGTNVQFQYITANTKLETLNGGKGVTAGDIRITDKNGTQYNVSLSQGEETLAEVIQDINGATAGNVIARINDNGDGILLEDTTGGSLELRVEDVSGSMAKDLNILGTTTENKIDGSFEYTIEIEAGDTLEDLASKINDAGGSFSAALINDGSGSKPYRLNLLSDATGSAGRLSFDLNSVGLDMSQTAHGEDAVILYGENTPGNQPVLIRSSSNTVKNVLPFLDLELKQASSQQVTITASRDSENVVSQVSNLVNSVNSALDAISDYTSFNSETFSSGLLLGETLTRNIESSLKRRFTSPLTNFTGPIRSMADIGVRISDTGVLTFDSSVLQDKLDSDPDAVKDFFSKRETTGEGEDLEITDIGFATLLENYIDQTANAFDGSILTRTDGLDLQVDDLNLQIEKQEEYIATLQDRLTYEFTQLELFINQQNGILSRLTSSLIPITSKK